MLSSTPQFFFPEVGWRKVERILYNQDNKSDDNDNVINAHHINHNSEGVDDYDGANK